MRHPLGPQRRHHGHCLPGQVTAITGLVTFDQHKILIHRGNLPQNPFRGPIHPGFLKLQANMLPRGWLVHHENHGMVWREFPTRRRLHNDLHPAPTVGHIQLGIIGPVITHIPTDLQLNAAEIIGHDPGLEANEAAKRNGVGLIIAQDNGVRRHDDDPLKLVLRGMMVD